MPAGYGCRTTMRRVTGKWKNSVMICLFVAYRVLARRRSHFPLSWNMPLMGGKVTWSQTAQLTGVNSSFPSKQCGLSRGGESLACTRTQEFCCCGFVCVSRTRLFYCVSQRSCAAEAKRRGEFSKAQKYWETFNNKQSLLDWAMTFLLFWAGLCLFSGGWTALENGATQWFPTEVIYKGVILSFSSNFFSDNDIAAYEHVCSLTTYQWTQCLNSQLSIPW